MARIRSIKPTFWTDEKLGQFDPLVRMTFLGLISAMADDSGRCKGDFRLVKAAIWPLDAQIGVDDVATHLQLLHESGRIVLYTVDATQFIQIVNWKRHQKIDKPRPSEIPRPPTKSSGKVDDDSTTPPRKLDDVSALERSGAEGIRSGIGSGADGARSFGADDPTLDDDPDPITDPVIRDDDRAAPPAPLVELPVEAHRFVEQLYSLSTPKRQLDVRRQLYDSLDPRGKGARLRKGVYVKARSAAHLAACCVAVLEDPPRAIDAAIVIVLEKLADPPPGPTPSELHKATVAATVAEEEAYQRASRAAAVTWAKEHPELYAPILAAVDHEFGDNGNAFKRMAREAALTQRCTKAAGFPSFDTWQAEHFEPVGT